MYKNGNVNSLKDSMLPKIPWPPLVTGLPGLHDNAASTDACR